jgi:hypothetical protein
MSLTIEQRARVARVVMPNGPYHEAGNKLRWFTTSRGTIALQMDAELNHDYALWDPSNSNEAIEWQRSQALALVEWVSKYIHDEPIGKTAMANRGIELSYLVQKKDIQGLESLVFELLEQP